jgi:D-glycero-D-manno-heptose 1,7-bisphosphate phosphatase
MSSVKVRVAGMNQKMKKALLLDRDGVININHGYVYRVEDCDFVDGIFELTRLAVSKNYVICIVTNQAGIGRGYYTESQFHDFTRWMTGRFRQEGVLISKVYYSPYHPTDGIGKYKKDDLSRKPNPGMLLDAINDFKIDAGSSVLIGDSVTDIQAGVAAGVGTNLYLGESDISKSLDEGLYTKIFCLSEGAAFLSSSGT